MYRLIIKVNYASVRYKSDISNTSDTTEMLREWPFDIHSNECRTVAHFLIGKAISAKSNQKKRKCRKFKSHSDLCLK